MLADCLGSVFVHWVSSMTSKYSFAPSKSVSSILNETLGLCNLNFILYNEIQIVPQHHFDNLLPITGVESLYQQSYGVVGATVGYGLVGGLESYLGKLIAFLNN